MKGRSTLRTERALCVLFFVVPTLVILLVAFPARASHFGRDEGTRRILQLADVFGDHMVLQASPKRARLWGLANGEPGSMSVFVDGAQVAIFSSKVNATGENAIYEWIITLEPVENHGPSQIRIVSEHEGEAMVQDVLFGEVFLCGGQSNMQMSVNMVEDGLNEASKATLQRIRILTAHPFPPDSKQDLQFQHVHLLHEWAVMSPQSVSPSVDLQTMTDLHFDKS